MADQVVVGRQKLVLMQQLTTDMWSRSRESISGGNFRFQELRMNRDVIIGTAQYLPSKPQIRNIRYKEIVEIILDYYQTPPQGDNEKLRRINDAYRLFLEIDAETDTLKHDHEFIRCLIYLAFPSITGDKASYEHAQRMLEHESFSEETNYLKKEYKYLMCWAARRMKWFPQAENIATSSINEFPDDGRFYHGRSLNSFAWRAENQALEKDSKKIQFEKDLDELFKQAVDDAERAIACYVKTSDSFNDVIAANYNNLAYFFVLKASEQNQTQNKSDDFLTKARNSLLKLKEILPVEFWKPNHPEYFHTEAFLEYWEANNYLVSPEKMSAASKKYQAAKTACQEAVTLTDKPLYKELLRIK